MITRTKNMIQTFSTFLKDLIAKKGIHGALDEVADLSFVDSSQCAEVKPPKPQSQVVGEILANNYQKTIDINQSPSLSPELQRTLLMLNQHVGAALVNGLSPFIGIQPMTGPVGLTFLMQYKQNINSSTSESSDVDNSGSQRIHLEIVSHAVEAYSRRLFAAWNMEAAQDVHAIHGIDIESEIVQALSQEILFEYTSQLFNDIKEKSETTELDLTKADITTDQLKFGVTINKLANCIGQKTRRGCGNYVVCSIKLASWMASNNMLTRKEQQPNFVGPTPTLYYGHLNDSIAVYSSTCINDEDCIVGYKGVTDVDCGYVLCPYIGVTSPGIVVNSTTFQQTVQLVTRYGQVWNKGFDTQDTTSYFQHLKVILPEQTENDTITTEENTCS